MKFGDDIEPIRYVGTALSHFQSDPIAYGKDGIALPPATDWEFELRKNLQGKPSGIKGQQNIEEMPRFLEKKEFYIKRSKELGQNMFAFSFEFGRLCPEAGVWNEDLMVEYIKTLALIRKHGQEPLVTLHHFTNPKFLTVIDKNEKIIKGAWEHPDILMHFKFYIKNVIASLKDEKKLREIFTSEGYDSAFQDTLISDGLLRYFITFNEPSIVALLGYVNGHFPPFKKWGFRAAHRTIMTMVKCHDIALKEIRTLDDVFISGKKTQVGVGYTWQYFDGLLGPVIQKINQYYTSIFERDGSYSDFIGVHYYFRQSSIFFNRRTKNRDYGDQPMFGDIYPQGIRDILKKMNTLYPTKDIFVSEIGFADSKGARRPFWLAETIKHVIEAREEGLPIRAILMWTLADNLEWDLGMNIANFGLFRERQLLVPLAPETDRIHSWEIWQKAIASLRHPSPEALAELEEYYERAKNRYYEEINLRAP